MLLPESHGGASTDLPSAMRIFEALARADASTGWVVMIGSTSWCDVAGLPREAFDALFAGTNDVIVAGVFNPTGTIAAVDGGYRVEGRWSFASGCEHADWLFGNCIEPGADGEPPLRMAVFAPGEITIEDTWNVSGLRGTGSHHFRAEGVVVPAERTCRPLADEPCLDVPIVRIPPPTLYGTAVASVAIGAAQGALDDIVALAADKVPLLAATPLAANPHFQFELATADTRLRAARALLYESAEEAWSTAVAGDEFTLPLVGRFRAAGAWVTATAAEVVDVAYRSGGGSSLYSDCPLQRRLRDIHAATQHFLVKPDTLTTAGAILARQDIGPMLF
jgi:alkylation response protein AidB-like acyl-CoA dehydrogenase